MRIAVCGLTGFANEVIKALHDSEYELALVVTRKEHGPHPYYREEQLEALCAKLSIACEYDAIGEHKIIVGNYDILLCASYHRILSQEVLDSVTHAINLHPSLLPAYRGATPVFAVLRNGELRTGVTAHLMDTEIDNGPIVLQRSIDISPTDTRGTLRKRLAQVAAGMCLPLLERDLHNVESNNLPEQEESYFPKASNEAYQMDPCQEEDDWLAILKAYTPWPGVVIQGMKITHVLAVGEALPSIDKVKQFGNTLVIFKNRQCVELEVDV